MISSIAVQKNNQGLKLCQKFHTEKSNLLFEKGLNVKVVVLAYRNEVAKNKSRVTKTMELQKVILGPEEIIILCWQSNMTLKGKMEAFIGQVSTSRLLVLSAVSENGTKENQVDVYFNHYVMS